MRNFQVLAELGRGSYGIVYKVQSLRDSQVYVLKKICMKHMKPKHQAAALKEVQILRTISHPHIIRYHTSFVEDDALHILMEYAEEGDLYRLLKEQRRKKKYFAEREVWRFAHELALAVEYLHSRNVMHRDIKCLNVFLAKDRRLKLGDMGVSKIVQSAGALQGTRVGTPLYLSPELIRQQPYDLKIDVWALGCAVYHLASLEPPFYADNLIALGNNIVHKAPKPLPSCFTPKLQSFIDKLLCKCSTDRPSAKDVLALFPAAVRRARENEPEEPAD